MKSLLTLLLLCLTAGLAHAQAADSIQLPVDPGTHRITYAGVVQVPGVSQAELYTRAKLWFAETFKSGKDVIQADEKEAGIVQGKGWSPAEAHLLGKNLPVSELRLWHTVKLACREGRYRYEITDFKSGVAGAGEQSTMEDLLATWVKAATKNGKPTKHALANDELHQAVSNCGNGLAASIKEGMARKPGSTSNGKDW